MRLFVLACCLLFGQIKLNNAKNIVTTDNSIADNDRHLEIQTQLLRIQDDIFSITSALGIVENLDIIDDQIDAIEGDFEVAKGLLAIERRQQTDNCRANTITMLNNQYKAINLQLQKLESSLKEYKQKRLPSETIADIKALRFDLAEEKIKKINNMKELSNIISTVYGNCSENYEILAEFIENLTDLELINFSVRILKNEMAQNGRKDPFKWIRLVKTLETQIINKPEVDIVSKQIAQLSDNELKESIKDFTLETLNTTVRKSKPDTNSDIENLTTAVYQLDPLLSKNIVEEFVNSNYEEVSSKKILQAINNHKFIQQKVRGVGLLIWKIQNANNLNSDVTIDIASVLSSLRSDNEFKNLSKTEQEEVDILIEKIPTCARNLFFLTSVCLWNKEKEEYLTAGNLSSRHDNSRRNIFSLDLQPGSYWNVDKIGKNFYFSSSFYRNEYLYAAAFNLNKDLRYVFNWLEGNNLDIQSAWSIELNGDYCYLKSAAYNEYLFSSNYTKLGSNNLKYAFTWVPGDSVRQPKFQWQIRKCE